MTKAELTTEIDNRWGNITSPKRLPILDREVATQFIDLAFPPITTDNGTTPTNTITTKQTISGVSFTYSFNFRKSGNRVDVTGRVAFSSGTTVNNQVGAVITNTEFLPRTGSNPPVFLNKESNNGDVLQILIFNTNGNMQFKHTGSLEAGIGYIADFFYFVND